MSNLNLSKIIPGVILTLSSCFLLGCTQAPSSEHFPSGGSGRDGRTDRLSAISIGAEGKLVGVPIDEEISTWLNTNEDSDHGSLPPIPKNDAWQSFDMPSNEALIIFDSGSHASFDLLEILAYPKGLDEDGTPVSVEVHSLCGPQAERSCADVASGESSVQIPLEVVDEAIADTEYYAIGGVLLPDGDSHPDSFMVLLRKNRD